MLSKLDRFRFAPSTPKNEGRGRAVEPPPPPEPVGVVVLRFVPADVHPTRQRGSVVYRDTSRTVPGFVAVVRGVRYDEPDDAMREADRIAEDEGRMVFIVGLP